MRPVIGITTNVLNEETSFQINRTFSDALIAAGALPILLPATTDPRLIAQYARQIDGLLLSGGEDVAPENFGETQSWHSGSVCPFRDTFEMLMCREVLKSFTKPIFGVCRGLQVLNVALGGSLYQDLQTAFPGPTLAHRQKQLSRYCSHDAAVVKASLLSHIAGGADVIRVNSLHHQAVNKPGMGMLVSATAPDGVIEAAELPGHPFCLGVQWHPERLWDQPGCEVHRKLFDTFVQACRKPVKPAWIIREAKSEDRHQAEEMTMRAFWNLHNPGCDEHYLVHLLWDDEAHLAELSRVAEMDGKIVGLIMYSRSKLLLPDGTEKKTLTFGPLCVDPDYQITGVGGALLRESLAEAAKTDYPGVIIFGEPDYYPRFGFKTCDTYGISTSDGANFDAFMALELKEGELHCPGARFHEAEVFERLNEKDTAEHTKNFPPLPRLKLPGQWG